MPFSLLPISEIMDYKIIIGEPEIEGFQKDLGAKTWPVFMQHDAIVNKYWPFLYTRFLNFQFALFENDEIAGIGNALPLNWQKSFTELPDAGMDWAMEKANLDFQESIKPNLLVGLQILVNKKYQGQGVSYEMLEIMKGIAKSNGIDTVALPVRPTLKCNYPLIPMDEYINWKNKDGLPFDPWIRVHMKAGGKFAGICNCSMDISAAVSDWGKWSGLIFHGSGNYIIDKALVPVVVDTEMETGRYLEPNVWITHTI